MRALHGKRRSLHVLDLIVLAGEREAATRHQALDDLQAFFHALDASAGAVQRNARLLVVRGHPPGAKPQIQAAIRQQIEGRGFLGQHHRMAIVVVENQRSDPQLRGGIGGGH